MLNHDTVQTHVHSYYVLPKIIKGARNAPLAENHFFHPGEIGLETNICNDINEMSQTGWPSSCNKHRKGLKKTAPVAHERFEEDIT